MQYVMIYLLVGVILSSVLIALCLFEQKSKRRWEREFEERACVAFVILGVIVTFGWLPILLFTGFFELKGRDENGKRG